MDKKEKATYLLYELNNIDDGLLEQARLYPAQKKRGGRVRLVVACCAVLLAVMMILPLAGVASLTTLLIGLDKGGVGKPPEEESVQSEVLKDEQVFTHPPRELFFGDEPVLVWKEEGSEEYHAIKLTATEFNRIEGLAASSQKVQEGDERPMKSVWICDGNGLVKSPYLENTPGNIYYATLFDYDPELVLSYSLEIYLEELTS